MVCKKPLNAVVIPAFFVGCKRDDEITIRHVMLLPVTQHRGNPDCGHRFVVGGSSAPKIAILLHKREWIQRPVGAQSFHDIQMSQQQNGLASSRTAISSYKIQLTRVWTEHLHVAIGKSGSLQPTGYCFCGSGRVAIGVGRIDFDQLSKNVARKAVVSVFVSDCAKQQERRQEAQHRYFSPPKSTSSGSSFLSVAGSYGKCMANC